MLAEFKKHIHENLPFLTKSKMLLAISGGMDSVVLAHLLKTLNYDFALAHCNFKLRSEASDKDEKFVIQLAKLLNVVCYTIPFDTKTYSNTQKISIQMAARNLRYNWFNELIEKYNYQHILTAHHTNDNLETVLINLTRGATLEKLIGIPEINDKIVRPLLPFTRNQIEQFTIDNQIFWREDQSNQSTKYFRNKIRHQVIPILKEFNSNVLTTFNTHNQFLKATHKVLQNHLKTVTLQLLKEDEKQLKIDIKKLQNLQEPSVYLHYILKNYGFTDWETVTNLLSAQSGKMVSSKTHRLLKDRGFLILEKNELLLQSLSVSIKKGISEIKKPIHLTITDVKTTDFSLKNTIFVAENTLKYPLNLRKKEKGDVFYPLGMKGKKKISKYFKDEKLSLSEKENTWLLCDADNKVIWIVNKRADNRFKINKTTQKIIKITLQILK